MSIATSHRSTRPREIGLRVRVLLRRGRLDRLLAAGSDPCWHPELELRAAQVTARRRRRVLAKSLERVVRDAQRPKRWACAAPLDSGAVEGAADELRALAAGLVDRNRPAAQGVFLAEQLLCDPASPLYAPGDEDALRAGARIARQALGEA
jgi:hypothetical protein